MRTAPGLDTSVYVPAIAGLNLEHYFDGRPRQSERAVFFEPRHAPMQFRRLSETKAELQQPPTPVYGVESRGGIRITRALLSGHKLPGYSTTKRLHWRVSRDLLGVLHQWPT
jgi:hypothetical protein